MSNARNRQFSKEEVKVAKMHIKMLSVFSIEDMQIKSTWYLISPQSENWPQTPERMQRKRNLLYYYTLSIMEISMKIYQETKNRTTIWSCYSTPGYVPQTVWVSIGRHLCTCAYCSTVCKSQVIHLYANYKILRLRVINSKLKAKGWRIYTQKVASMAVLIPDK
jgi:hypothetical protein